MLLHTNQLLEPLRLPKYSRKYPDTLLNTQVLLCRLESYENKAARHRHPASRALVVKRTRPCHQKVASSKLSYDWNGLDLTFRKTAGFLNTPTPGGVPVKNTSPGYRVTNLQTLNKHNVPNNVPACPALGVVLMFAVIGVQK